jgi:FAD/FMN-containing dehydrogenase/SAM-dependent methyltransferase
LKPAASLLVHEVTGLNPVPVFAVANPTCVADVVDALQRTAVPVSVGGGHFSMGGQTASPGSLHLDLRALNRVLQFSPVERTLRVEAGIRWCDIQKFLDPHGLAVSIMQTYANFTVGGSLSVNVHGRYVGLGPIVLSVREIRLVLPGGDVIDASPQLNAELFYAAIGGYGAIGVIVEVVLELAENRRVERVTRKMALEDYAAFFRAQVRDAAGIVFHNADLYAPDFERVRAVSWIETTRPATTRMRLQWQHRRHAAEKYLLWAVTETPFGKWRREYLLDPLLYARRAVHWRNYEAGYDVAELEPVSRRHTTYVLQEYFIPVERFLECARAIRAVLMRHRVNALNVSVRHAIGDPGTLLAWARGETFAFVLYHKQRTRPNALERVGVWTRELIDAVLACGGTYYLPYQLNATRGQFQRAYPRARELFALKQRLDPGYRLRNALWDKYYAPEIEVRVDYPARIGAAYGAPIARGRDAGASEFHAVMCEASWSDAMYRFLHNVFRLHPEDRFHLLIREACENHADDEAIYRYIQRRLPTIKPRFADLTYAIPALRKQQREMLRQTLELLGARQRFDGYVEIGSTGRYASVLRRELELGGRLVMINDVPPRNSPPDILDRGGLRKLGRYVPLADYTPLPEDPLPDASVDLVSCYIGLHHIAPDRLQPFMHSIARVLRPGGFFVLRDHDVQTPEMFRFVSLIHSVFNAGTGASWEQNRDELRHFVTVDEWVRRLAGVGLAAHGPRLLQPNDPSDNVLMAFERVAEHA